MLKIFLLANCMSCAGFGAIFTIAPAATAEFVGDPPQVVIAILGALLLGNAILLAVTAWRWSDRRALIAFFVLGDVLWVAMTIGLVLLGMWISGSAAIFLSTAVACIVGTLGYGQYHHGLRRPKAVLGSSL